MPDAHESGANRPADPRAGWAQLSQSERDAAYDNNTAVANSPELIAERNATSARARATLRSVLDLPYGPRKNNKIDLYPAADPDAPCLLFLHGGYWQKNTRELFAMMVEGVAAHGWSMAIPGYSLAPEVSLTEIVDEVRQALDWLAAHAPDHGVAGPVVTSGWSAGGHLVAMTLDHPLVAAGLSISGVFDLAPLRDTGLNTALQLTDAEIETLSPLRLPVIDKRLDLAYGDDELPTLVLDSINLHARRSAAGAPGLLLPIAGHNHFSILAELRRPDGALVRAARDLAGETGNDRASALRSDETPPE
ncbi:alpha/beta hydrolase [Rhodopseudomonas palustris]|uniref:alpha/beta hydrolase n=1 Tax=Rhodopseudomonas palustris TaxID=1076 RepID=UPI002ACDF771|nr:alpha/beta hydrolase [Rhodopseudomonas palustris]WQG99852.1 alpha/beta hydrolase [Rhodopseudomonas palustris]